MGLQEGKGRWGAASVDEATDVSAIVSTTDGATATKNLIIARKDNADFATNYYAFNWIYTTINGGDINGRWYIPAKDELVALYNAYSTDKTAFDNKLTTSGGVTFATGYYWSATQRSISDSWPVSFRSGNMVPFNKVNPDYRVRGVSAF